MIDLLWEARAVLAVGVLVGVASVVLAAQFLRGDLR